MKSQLYEKQNVIGRSSGVRLCQGWSVPADLKTCLGACVFKPLATPQPRRAVSVARHCPGLPRRRDALQGGPGAVMCDNQWRGRRGSSTLSPL